MYKLDSEIQSVSTSVEVFREVPSIPSIVLKTQFRTPPPCKTLVERLGKNPSMGETVDMNGHDRYDDAKH